MRILDLRFPVFFVILLLLGACFNSSSHQPDNVVKEGSDSSLDRINEALIENPNDPALYLDRAKLLRGQRNVRGAFEDVERALSIDSLLPEAHHEMGLLYYMDGQLGEAKFAFERAVALDASFTPSMLQLAEIYLVLRNYDRAMSEVNNALKIDQQIAQAYFLKGLIYKEQKNKDLAKSSFQTATELDPQNVEAFNLLGMLYAEEDDGLAMSYYNTVLDIDSAHKEALYNRAYFLQDQGHAEEAISAYDLLLKFHPGTAAAFYNKGFIYFGFLEDAPKAIDAFTEAIKSNPKYIQAYFNRAVALEEIGRKEAAIADYKNVIELEPGNAQSLAALNRLGAR